MIEHRGTRFPALLTQDGIVHKHQGGGPGMHDGQGRRIYFEGLPWCENKLVAGVPVDRPVTCQDCLDTYAAFEREHPQSAPSGRPAGGGG